MELELLPLSIRYRWNASYSSSGAELDPSLRSASQSTGSDLLDPLPELTMVGGDWTGRRWAMKQNRLVKCEEYGLQFGFGGVYVGSDCATLGQSDVAATYNHVLIALHMGWV